MPAAKARDLYLEYADCEGNNHNWVLHLHIEYEDFTMPPDADQRRMLQRCGNTRPPVVYDNCGMLITPTGPSVGGTYAGCEGTVTYTWNYADCEGNNHNWVYTTPSNTRTSPCRLMPDRPSNASAMW